MTQVKKRGGGRPRKPAAERLSERLWMVLTPAEADRVMRAAVRNGESVSEYLRRRLASILDEQRAEAEF
jgi:hypothetical protein